LPPNETGPEVDEEEEDDELYATDDVAGTYELLLAIFDALFFQLPNP
jgi:hypothetical protein